MKKGFMQKKEESERLDKMTQLINTEVEQTEMICAIRN